MTMDDILHISPPSTPENQQEDDATSDASSQTGSSVVSGDRADTLSVNQCLLLNPAAEDAVGAADVRSESDVKSEELTTVSSDSAEPRTPVCQGVDSILDYLGQFGR